MGHNNDFIPSSCWVFKYLYFFYDTKYLILHYDNI